jgi:hypothetical protein
VPAEQQSPPGATPAVAPGKFSADGFWWWDGAAWKPAYSQDRLWRWTGASWVPAASQPPRSSNLGLWLGVGIGLFVLVLVVVAVIVVLVLGSIGSSFTNIFSNLVVTSPTP